MTSSTASFRSKLEISRLNLPELSYAKSRRSSTRKLIIFDDESWILLLYSIILAISLIFLLRSPWREAWFSLIKLFNSFKHKDIFKFYASILYNGFLNSWDTVALVIARNWFSACTSSYKIDLVISTIEIIVFNWPFLV